MEAQRQVRSLAGTGRPASHSGKLCQSPSSVSSPVQGSEDLDPRGLASGSSQQGHGSSSSTFCADLREAQDQLLPFPFSSAPANDKWGSYPPSLGPGYIQSCGGERGGVRLAVMTTSSPLQSSPPLSSRTCSAGHQQ